MCMAGRLRTGRFSMTSMHSIWQVIPHGLLFSLIPLARRWFHLIPTSTSRRMTQKGRFGHTLWASDHALFILGGACKVNLDKSPETVLIFDTLKIPFPRELPPAAHRGSTRLRMKPARTLRILMMSLEVLTAPRMNIDCRSCRLRTYS